MSSSFIPMDTPNQPCAAPAESTLPRVCSPTGSSRSAVADASSVSGSVTDSSSGSAPVDDAASGPAAAAPDAVERSDAGATTANLRAGLAERLRSAYEQGADLGDLAVASHQSVSEVRELLALAGAAADGQTAAAEPRDVSVPAQRDGARALQGAADGWTPRSGRPRPRVRRQLPPRRANRPGAPSAPATGDGHGWAPAEPQAPAVPAEPVAPLGGGAEAPAVLSEAPLGVLIGSPRQSVPLGGARAEDSRRRVGAKLIKVGRGTALAVLPAWRPSIAISVPTELLLDTTGLSRAELAEAELTVVVNTEALHDRELQPRDWQVAAERPGARRRS
ncbi:hypothetical protein P3T35_007650 [Kitasatospora sp. GP30]|uniref:hypothetical protein n=1 Tax=Kitasatospora sp. GP30 TaxID=3035084 RepID=UPI000C70B542|nr:hypothetical protein [Kitasatospora sp. GP30]MDH6145595.1 hypothetical protein [Kitasatospora sp. GP30]